MLILYIASLMKTLLSFFFFIKFTGITLVNDIIYISGVQFYNMTFVYSCVLTIQSLVFLCHHIFDHFVPLHPPCTCLSPLVISISSSVSMKFQFSVCSFVAVFYIPCKSEVSQFLSFSVYQSAFAVFCVDNDSTWKKWNFSPFSGRAIFLFNPNDNFQLGTPPHF